MHSGLLGIACGYMDGLAQYQMSAIKNIESQETMELSLIPSYLITTNPEDYRVAMDWARMFSDPLDIEGKMSSLETGTLERKALYCRLRELRKAELSPVQFLIKDRVEWSWREMEGSGL